MHSMHCVQFSARKIGVCRRATYLVAASPVAAAVTPGGGERRGRLVVAEAGAELAVEGLAAEDRRPLLLRLRLRDAEAVRLAPGERRDGDAAHARPVGGVHRAVDDLAHPREALEHDLHVRGDDGVAEAAELLPVLLLDLLVEVLAVDPELLRGRARRRRTRRGRRSPASGAAGRGARWRRGRCRSRGGCRGGSSCRGSPAGTSAGSASRPSRGSRPTPRRRRPPRPSRRAGSCG